MKSPLNALSSQLSELMLRDRQRLQRRLQGAAKVGAPQAQAAIAQEIEGEIAIARQKVENRRAGCPAVSYPEQLPVSQKKIVFCRRCATIR